MYVRMYVCTYVRVDVKGPSGKLPRVAIGFYGGCRVILGQGPPRST